MSLSTYFPRSVKSSRLGLKTGAGRTAALGTISQMSTSTTVQSAKSTAGKTALHPLETDLSRQATTRAYSQAINPRIISRSRLTTRGYASQSSAGADRRRISLSRALCMYSFCVFKGVVVYWYTIRPQKKKKVFSGFLASSSYLLGLFAPPDVITLFRPRPIPPPPPENSEEARRIIAKVEKDLNELDVLKKCREAPGKSVSNHRGRSACANIIIISGGGGLRPFFFLCVNLTGLGCA